MRLIDADDAKKQIRQMQTLKPSEKALLMLALDRTPTHDPPNDPLTPEELREMDGEPVFIKRIGSNHPDDRAWALVDVGHELCKTVDGVKAFFEFFGKSWLAYRRKPEAPANAE